MEWTTHCLSGMAAGHMVTGGDWRAALVGGLAGVIPDLDDHKSKVGKVLLPLAYFLNKTFGHRTITHSLLFAFLAGIILYLFTDPWIWLAAFAGIMAHSLGDMLTGKVRFFYPAQKSFGISTSPLMFNMIGRLTAILLLVYIGRETLMTLI
ncbi:metal-dependent hydrolase [Lentibacillus sp. CBA3610]|uniref:metal-dependent hydrolase n=1 Tax=Lentibacillus sp. CBA3610 TaxID=2518176 RepID=UPI00159566AC|nr:metal-dependent hydrolase [Lentibacillus sp. CBA3610]QKY69436.1 metal-dependent hydrolase [Lentibacillus sp. CBA3610]